MAIYEDGNGQTYECPPDILFKYLPLDTKEHIERVIDIFRTNSIYASTCDKLNDPFEGAFFDYPGVSDSVIEDKIKKTHILALSKTCFSAPMWAYYGKDYTGICLGFNTVDSFSCALEAQYNDSRKWFSSDFTDFNTDLLIKSNEWSYEKEYRIVFESDDPFFHFKENDLACVIFGSKTSDESISIVKRCLNNHVKTFRINVDKENLKLCVESQISDIDDLVSYLKK